MLMLASVVVVLSAADLYITVLFLATTGMAEENPLARLVMSHGSVGYLAGWKFLTVLPAFLLMVAYRRRVLMEVLGWVACAVLVGVMVRWLQYAQDSDIMLVALHALEEGVDSRWVTLVPPSW